MSKIDEIIKKFLDDLFSGVYGTYMPRDAPVVKELEQLRPYVELAEILIDNPTAFMIKWLFSGRHFGLDTRFNELYHAIHKEKT